MLRIYYGTDIIPTDSPIRVSNTFPHPYYRIDHLHHDIALLKLSGQVDQNNYDFVQLPKTITSDYLGQTATVSGWGDDGTVNTSFFNLIL